MLRSLVLALGLASLTSLFSGSAWAAKPYVDTKKRFSLELAAGWELAPLPGDTSGMVFRKRLDSVPGTLRVSVRPLRPGETTKQTLDDIEEGARAEIGYKPGGDLPTTVGALAAVRRTFSVFASGDAKTVRAIEVIALHAFGHAHVLHFETLESKRGAFTRDLDRMIASYEPLVGRGVYGGLVGNWINLGGGPDLILEEDGRFQLGPLKGGYQADGGRLVLRVPEGGESYRYAQVDNTLTLSSPNLGDDMKFRRSGAARVKVTDERGPRPSGPLTREELIGTWRVVDSASTDVMKLKLAPSGSVSFGGLSGQWRYSTGRLTITSTAGASITYSASRNDGKLVLGGGDLDHDLTLVRE